MKKKLFFNALFFLFLSFVFAQADLQVIAQVNLFKKEPITLAQVKKMITNFESAAGRSLSFEERKQVLIGLLGQRLLAQASEKEGVRVLDSEVTEYFNNVLSNQVGHMTNEVEFAKMIKQEYNQSLDEFFISTNGMNVAEAKKMLKDELTIQKYVMLKKSSEIESMARPTDADIRKQYELNKQAFFRPETMKLVIVGVMKNGDDTAETAKITQLHAKVKANIKTLAEVQKDAEKNGYAVQTRYAVKNTAGAQALALPLEALMQIFEHNVNYVSEVIDRPDNKQFFVITEKYNEKILNLSDIIDPSQPVTVYEYVKNMLAGQMQTMALQQANQSLIQELKTNDNFKILKTDDELQKLFKW